MADRVFPPRQDLDPACSAKGPAQADPDALSASQKAAQRAAERRRDRGRDKERGIGRFGAAAANTVCAGFALWLSSASRSRAADAEHCEHGYLPKGTA